MISHRGRHTILCVILSFAICGAAWMFIHGRARGVTGSQLAIQTSVDFGVVDSDKKVSTVVKIENHGTETLRISKIITDCGCTTASAKKTDIEPGGCTELSVSFDPVGLMRKVRRRIVIESNDSHQGLLTLPVEAYVKIGVRPEMNRIDLGTGDVGSALHGTVRIFRDLKTSVGLLRPKAPIDGWTVSVGPWTAYADAEACVVEINVDALQDNPGRFVQQIELTDGTSVHIPLEAVIEVLPPLRCVPPVIRVAHAKATTATIRFSAANWRVISVESVYGRCITSIISQNADHCEIQIATVEPPKDDDVMDVIWVKYASLAPVGAKTTTFTIPVLLKEETPEKE